ncbi:MAG: YdcF family protein [Bacteroidetes bacterium]|nr:YdcF family protein [Bacteroidota bacterium]
MKPHIRLVKRRTLLWTLLVLFSLVLGAYVTIGFYAYKYTYSSMEELPYNRVGLVLGTSKKVANGRANMYFTNRIAAAAALYQLGKIDYILVSGDNRQVTYNEPRDMLNALLEAGIPRERIVLDYAGFRTLDSIVRCKEVFGQDTYTIISQRFHNERAVFLAHAHGINAIAYNARDVERHNGLKTRIREVFARSKVFIDLLIEKKPKFLGESVPIGE